MTEQQTEAVTRTDPEVPDLDGVTGYEDGDAHVVCDRENPNAWIRSDHTVELSV
jgi:hypothetical protein